MLAKLKKCILKNKKICSLEVSKIKLSSKQSFILVNKNAFLSEQKRICR